MQFKNKRMVHLAAASAVLAVSVMGSTALAWRQGHGGPGGPHGGPPPDAAARVEHMAKFLDLTDDQKTQVKAIFDDEDAKTAAYRAQLDATAKAIHDATANGAFDEAKVRELAASQANAMTEVIVEHERSRARVYAVLTDEQRAKAPEPPPGFGPGFGPGGPRPGGPHPDGPPPAGKRHQ